MQYLSKRTFRDKWVKFHRKWILIDCKTSLDSVRYSLAWKLVLFVFGTVFEIFNLAWSCHEMNIHIWQELNITPLELSWMHIKVKVNCMFVHSCACPRYKLLFYFAVWVYILFFHRYENNFLGNVHQIKVTLFSLVIKIKCLEKNNGTNLEKENHTMKSVN